MAFNLGDEIAKYTTQLTSKAKESAISTLKDPEFKATVNQFTRDWFEEHKVIIVSVVTGCFLLSFIGIANILSNFSARK